MFEKRLRLIAVLGVIVSLCFPALISASEIRVIPDAEDPFQEVDRIQNFQFESSFLTFKKPAEGRNIQVAQELTALSVDASRDPKFSGPAI